MTIADMSVITAEIRVDETDIVNVKLGQNGGQSKSTRYPTTTFHGHVTEIGNTALVRSTGVAASQSATSSNEAKDFKVVIAIDNPPDSIRPGLSCTAKNNDRDRQKCARRFRFRRRLRGRRAIWWRPSRALPAPKLTPAQQRSQ